eukprot:scaffold157456_cov27-Tisochrysis_lutea.AAC.1
MRVVVLDLCAVLCLLRNTWYEQEEEEEKEEEEGGGGIVVVWHDRDNQYRSGGLDVSLDLLGKLRGK